MRATAAVASSSGRTGPPRSSLRGFLSHRCAGGQLHSVTRLDLSACRGLAITRDEWAALLGALGAGPVTLRVDWHSLLAHGTAGLGAGRGAGARRGGGVGPGAGGAGPSGRGGGASTSAATIEDDAVDAAVAARAAAKAAALAEEEEEALALPPPPPPPPAAAEPLAAPLPRCAGCPVCGAAPAADGGSVWAALCVLAAVRPAASLELAGRGLPLPLRSSAVAAALAGPSGGGGCLAAASVVLCGGGAPLSQPSAWPWFGGGAAGGVAAPLSALSALTRLTSLELAYRDEPGGEPVLGPVLRALRSPVPLRALSLSRLDGSAAPLGEAELGALAAWLPGLEALEAPGLRLHSPLAPAALAALAVAADASASAALAAGGGAAPRALGGGGAGAGAAAPPPLGALSRLALRGDKLELLQPLAGLFPGLTELQLGTAAADLPPHAALVAAAEAAAAAAIAPSPHAAAGADWPLLEPPLGVAGAAADAELAAADDAGEAVALAPLAGAGEAAGQPGGLPGELMLPLRLLQGLSGLRMLCIGGRPGSGVEALSSLTGEAWGQRSVARSEGHAGPGREQAG
jgi:hypothetical protein